MGHDAMRAVGRGAMVIVLALSTGCASNDQGDAPGGRDLDAERRASCGAEDIDGDGIADAAEGQGDADGDGVPNAGDDDADGDGIPDREEKRSDHPCAPADSDTDSVPDFLDVDSDDDGLPDAREAELGTDPTSVDSDGDGVSDLGEVAGSGTDPLDRTSTIPEEDFFVVLPYEGEHEKRDLRFGTGIEVADVFFLIDMTGSMQEERTNLVNGLLDVIVPGIQDAIPDVQFGVAGLDDYPVDDYGTSRDLPFYLLRGIAPYDEDLGTWSLDAAPRRCPEHAPTKDIGRIEGGPNGTPDLLEAVQGLPCHLGNDWPESYVPALWATATGMGLDWPGGSVPPRTCPSIPDESGIRRGYPCFRPGALPIVLLIGDSAFHNGPDDFEPYDFDAPRYDETVAALNDLGARVLGIFSGETPMRGRVFYAAIAHHTGAVELDGSPLVFDIRPDGSGLDTTVVEAVSALVGGTPQEVSTRSENVSGNPDGFDATRFIQAITPLEGYRNGVAGQGYETSDDTTFHGVIPGTVVEFEVDFHNDVRPPADTAEIFRATIYVVGNGVADLDSRNVYIVVPPEKGNVLI